MNIGFKELIVVIFFFFFILFLYLINKVNDSKHKEIVGKIEDLKLNPIHFDLMIESLKYINIGIDELRIRISQKEKKKR
jgi:hypothetical protein